MVVTDASEWQSWIADQGTHGVLRIQSPEDLPPGLKETLEFERFELFLPSHERESLAVDQGGCVEVRINAGLISEESVEAGTIRRVIRTGETVQHVLFGLPKGFWNSGNAKAMPRVATDKATTTKSIPVPPLAS